MSAADAVWVPQLKALVEPLVRDSFLELFDLSVRRQGNRYVVEVVLDRPDGVVKVDDCARVSHDLEARLDELDLIPSAYVLEVSSPGLDRPLRSLAECERAKGHKALVTASEPVEGQVSFEGILEAVDEGAVVMRMGEKRRVAIPWAKVRMARRVPEI